MATTPIEFRAPSGLTLTAELYPYGSDTLANTGGDAATEETNRKGLYTADVTEALSGWHTLHIKNGTSVIGVEDIYLEDTTAIHRVESAPARLYDGSDETLGSLASAQQLIQDLLEADRYIDTGVTPWALVLIKKGSGTLSTGTELLRQELTDIDGNDIIDTDTIIGNSVSP